MWIQRRHKTILSEFHAERQVQAEVVLFGLDSTRVGLRILDPVPNQRHIEFQAAGQINFQRGGSVTSDIRFGAKVHSPLVPTGEADFVLVMHPSQEANNSHHLKKEGIFISVSGFLGEGKSKISDLDADESNPVTERNCNIALLGILSEYLPFDDALWEASIRGNLPARFHDDNLEVFAYGKTRAAF